MATNGLRTTRCKVDNIIISVNSASRAVLVNTEKIAHYGENLQGQFVVEFVGDVIDGEARLDVFIVDKNKKGYISLTKQGDTYIGDIQSNITCNTGKIKMQVVIKQSATASGSVPIFKSEIFEVIIEESINAEQPLTNN